MDMVLAGFKKKLLIQISIAVGAALVLSIFIILLNLDINAQAEEIDQVKVQLALRARTIELLTSSRSDVEKANLLLARMQNMIPTEAELFAFPREMQRVGKLYSVDTEFSFIGSQTAGSDQQLGSTKFTMNISGAYADIIAFLKYIENSDYIMPFDFIDLSRSKDKEVDKFSLMTSGVLYIK